MRFSWTLTVTLNTVSGLKGIADILATILAPMEVFRYVHLLSSPDSLFYLSPGFLLYSSSFVKVVQY